jgi:hypothetical protein
MRVWGTIEKLTKLIFLVGTKALTFRPYSGQVYSVDRTMQLPPGDFDQDLVGTMAVQTLTNKTIDATQNTITNVLNNIDGGSPTSTYTAAQVVTGGTP